jgi:hypothetical protein
MFTHIRLQQGDREALERTRYPREAIGDDRIPLPCPMLEGTCCSIYPDRPHKCRTYRCDVLKAVEDEALPIEEALGTVRQARALLARLRELMPENLSVAAGHTQWTTPQTNPQSLAPGEAAARLAFYAFHLYLDRHFRFRKPRFATRTSDPAARPARDKHSSPM